VVPEELLPAAPLHIDFAAQSKTVERR